MKHRHLVVLLAGVSLAGCSTFQALTGANGTPATQLCSTASQCVYQAKGVFAGALIVANGYGSLPACPQGAPVCKDETLLAGIKSQAHSTKDALDQADEVVNGGLLNGLPATPDQINAAVSQATALVNAFKTATTSLPHH